MPRQLEPKGRDNSEINAAVRLHPLKRLHPAWLANTPIGRCGRAMMAASIATLWVSENPPVYPPIAASRIPICDIRSTSSLFRRFLRAQRVGQHHQQLAGSAASPRRDTPGRTRARIALSSSMRSLKPSLSTAFKSASACKYAAWQRSTSASRCRRSARVRGPSRRKQHGKDQNRSPRHTTATSRGNLKPPQASTAVPAHAAI